MVDACPPLASSEPGLLGAVRGSPEYAALFDLEVWRSEQRARFVADWERAKAQRLALLDGEHQDRLQEVGRLRAGLRDMAKSMKDALADVAARSTALDEREAGMERARLQAARAHEEALLELEARTRHAMVEAQQRQDAARAALAEKAASLEDLQARHAALQKDHDALTTQLLRARHDQAERHSADGAHGRELQAAADEAKAAVVDAREARREATDLRQARDDAREACRFYKTQLLEAARKHNALVAHVERQERRRVSDERQRLDDAARAAERQRLMNDTTPAAAVVAPRGTPGTGGTRGEAQELRDAVGHMAALLKTQHEQREHSSQLQRDKERRHRRLQRRAARAAVEAPEDDTAEPVVAVFDVSSASSGACSRAAGSAAGSAGAPGDDTLATVDLQHVAPPVAEEVAFDPPPPSTAATAATSDPTEPPELAVSTPAEADTARAFLRQLEHNRVQLLATGVYTTDDPIIADMDRKIDAYRAAATVRYL